MQELEQLKMILETITSLGTGAKDAFFWYVIGAYGSGVLECLLCVGGVMFIAYLIYRSSENDRKSSPPASPDR